MAENKTKQTNASVAAFIGAITDEKKRADARALVAKSVAAMRAKYPG